MPDPDLRVAVQAAEGGLRIELVGELDVAKLTFADSSGLDTLMRLAKALRAQDRRLVLTNLRPMVRRAMDVLEITELFELEEAP